MPYHGLGARHDAVATKACVHGQIVTEDRQVGAAFKNTQLGAFVDPQLSAAQQIAIGETFTMLLGGKLEAQRAGSVATAVVGDRIWIAADDNSLILTDPAGTNEVQNVTITATGGTLTYGLDDVNTAAVAFNAATSAVQAALETLPAIRPGDVVVSGTPSALVISFAGRYAGQNVPTLVLGTGSLTGGTATVSTPTPGAGNELVFPVGVVDEIDSTRTPSVLRIDAENLAAFMTRGS